VSENPLGPARGVIIGVLLGMALWMTIYLVARFA
jgi:hypothetical protein